MDKTTFFKNFRLTNNVLRTSALSLLLFVIENLLETEFRCPPPGPWAQTYSLVFFLVPAFIWFVVSLRLKSSSCPCLLKGQKCASCCWITKEVLWMPLLWVILLVMDGRYGACFIQSLQENSPQEAGFNSLVLTYVQVAGMFSLAVLALLWVVFTCDNSCGKPCSCCPEMNCYSNYLANEYLLTVLADVDDITEEFAASQRKQAILHQLNTESFLEVSSYSLKKDTIGKLSEIKHTLKRNILEENEDNQ
ncbi:hypothetical protein NDU88_005998 [Pleurodeles waltl]|uniref:Uncharacterized protein n=1 Tax=Pleurodeles waltl TaxID=8319 RepID=A0AAV7TC88_PLEWA|nr:hypothetical protein NDU88_005998 [Pleurodeles waltl]